MNLSRGVPFTPETAAEAAAKSVIVRAERKQELEDARALLAAKPPDGGVIRAQRLAKQMDSVERMMEKEQDSKELANLSAAHARLFSAWCVLTGTKSPGTMGKSRRERPSAPQPIPAPLDNPQPTAESPDWHKFTG